MRLIVVIACLLASNALFANTAEKLGLNPPQAEVAQKPETQPADSKTKTTDEAKEDEKKAEEDPYASDTFALPEGVMATQAEAPPVPDKLQPFNRSVFNFNTAMDKNIIVPVAKVYNKVMPKPLNEMVDNFFTNLEMIPTFINDILQGNFYQASSDGWRFTVNTTVGIAGLYDPAHHMGLEYHNTDFGLTLAKWGWNPSNYLILPIFGPSTVRDTIGGYVNVEYMSVYGYIKPFSAQLLAYGASLFNERAQLLQYQGVIDNAALDPYVFQRDAYLQRRAYLLERSSELDNPNTVAETRAFHSADYLYS